MIDNPDQVERLVAKLRESLPLLATVTPEVAAVVREQSPEADPSRRYTITRVDYAGDEGGLFVKWSLVLRTTTGLFSPQLLTYDSVMQVRSLVRLLHTRSIGSNALGVLVREVLFDSKKALGGHKSWTLRLLMSRSNRAG